MARSDVDSHFQNIDLLVAEIEAFVPSTGFRNIQFRADLAGLLVVAMAAAYETCVKEIIYERANRHHVSFGEFATRNFDKLNSRIQVSDLERYCKLFDPMICAKFKRLIRERKGRLLQRSGKNIETSYHQILSWRHDFAHARIRNTTIEEASKTHTVGKRIIYLFDEAMAAS